MISEKERIKIQTSETFLLSSLLALSGGFQDAYTYNVRDKVFSNAQTGNVVLMSQHLMQGEWQRALHYLFPVLAFALGVLVAEQIGHKYKGAKRIHWRQLQSALLQYSVLNLPPNERPLRLLPASNPILYGY